MLSAPDRRSKPLLAMTTLIALAVTTGISAQTSRRDVFGWRFGASAGAVQVLGDFEGASPSPSAGFNIDWLGRSGRGIGVGADFGVYDPTGDRFLVHTVRVSPRYHHVGSGAAYYTFLGFDAVGAYYQADRTVVPVNGEASSTGFGLGLSVGAGGLVGSGGLKMEIILSYQAVDFRDASVGGLTIVGTAARAHILRFILGVWFG